MHRLEWEERQQLAEELAARGVCLEDAREWFEVGMVEATKEGPREPRTRRGSKGWKSRPISYLIGTSLTGLNSERPYMLFQEYNVYIL